ncbi:MAG TPA: tetratricopeptide repeat protein [Chitinophaga sp.]|uniref:tetratricopeptide repeat protein n=1 Tax=Chitinophaga sp. TaxID=1869181 RepID=UPI002CBA2E97|nr:tetratricopeptide repeat protein [Chitinophaga sp.]HVI49340.1 tetratricopeptide repeat protein [Chitinophaga sp.]
MKKYLSILLILAGAACNNSRQQSSPAAATADSALYSDIVKPLTDSIRQFPDQHLLYYKRALLLFNTNPALARADFEKAAGLFPQGTDYWAGAGEAALITNDFRLASTFFTKALGTAPGNPYLQYRLATALIENKSYAQADSLANVLAQTKEAAGRAFFLKARIAEDHQDTTAAIQHLTAGINAGGKNAEYSAIMELGDLLGARKSAKAVKYYRLAWQQDSLNAEPMYAIAQYYESTGDRASALSAYRQCIVADPGFEQAYLALGEIYSKQQQWKEALSYYNLAVKSAPTDAWAYYHRGRCQEQLGNNTAAKEDYTKAISFKKDFKEAQAALQKLVK